jgi:two-component system alkaline phosphatase synthesis response regulator PhoP
MKVLVADDEPDILELLEYAFQKEGFDVICAHDGEEALQLAEQHLPDMILLDVMMPKMDGIEACRRLRQDPGLGNPIILILTARSEEYSEVAGFQSGADDYVTKPVKLRSLLHRLDALRKRSHPASPEAFAIGPFVIDRSKYLILKDGEGIKLPRKEFELLYLLGTQPGKVVSRERIFEEIWGPDVAAEDRTIDVHIRRIRMKIGDQHIQTVKGVGYRFAVAD